jgi:hypothetical protein
MILWLLLNGYSGFPMKLTSIRDENAIGYLEHVYLDGDLIATIYDTTDRVKQPEYKFSCKYKLSPSEPYTSVADCKHDLFLLIEFNTTIRL